MKNYLLAIVKTVGENVYVLLVRFAWWGFASATDRQRIEGAVLRRGVRSGLYIIPSQQTGIIWQTNYSNWSYKVVIVTLHELLTDRVDISYNLRSRSHDRVLPEKKGQTRTFSLWCWYIKILANSLIFSTLFSYVLLLPFISCVLSTVFFTNKWNEMNDSFY